jgi:hypothetical protein
MTGNMGTDSDDVESAPASLPSSSICATMLLPSSKTITGAEWHQPISFISACVIHLINATRFPLKALVARSDHVLRKSSKLDSAG